MAAQPPAPTGETREFELAFDETELRDEMREMLDSWERREWGPKTFSNVISYFRHTLDYLDRITAPIVIGK